MTAEKKKEPTYEEMVAQLEEIVQSLEEGALSLDASMGAYEKGVKILKSCYTLLERKEKKIQELTEGE